MAIAECWECGKRVSTQASICPSCGAKKPSKRLAQSAALQNTKKTPRWLIFALWGLAGVILIGGVLSRMAGGTSVQPKSELLKLCEIRLSNVDKNRSYLAAGNLAYAFDTQDEIRKIDKKLAGYTTEEKQRVCGISLSRAAAADVNSNVRPASAPVSQAVAMAKTGCLAAPYEIFGLEKSYNPVELKKQLADVCHVDVVAFDRAAVVKWNDQQLSLGFKEEGTDGPDQRIRIVWIKAL